MKNRMESINQKVLKALEQVAKEENVTFSFGGSGYSDIYYESKLIVTSMSDEDKKIQEEENESFSKMLGFSENVIGKTFKSGRSTFTITKLNLNRPKYPVSAENKNGKAYKFPVDAVKRLFT